VRTHLCVAVVAGFLSVPLSAQLPSDVPTGHRAAKAVKALVALGVMRAPGGRFGGSTVVTREELAPVLLRFVQVVEQNRHSGFPAAAKRTHTKDASWQARPVTRYEVAETLYRVGGYLAVNRPVARGKPDLSGATPVVKSAAALKGSGPAYAAARELIRRRMVWRKLHKFDSHSNDFHDNPDSILLAPDSRAVKGSELADALAQIVAGYYDTRTSEPQMREDSRPARTPKRSTGRGPAGRDAATSQRR